MKTVDKYLKINYILNVFIIFFESSSVWYGVIIPWVLFLLFLFQYDCSTMLSQFLLHSNVNQLYPCIDPLILGPASSLHPTRTGLSSLCYTAASPLVVRQNVYHFTHGRVHVNSSLPICPTLCVPLCPQPIVYIRISIPALQAASWVPFFQIPYIH